MRQTETGEPKKRTAQTDTFSTAWRCSFFCSHHPVEPSQNLVEPSWNHGGTLVEPWWNPGGTLVEPYLRGAPDHPGAYLG